MSLNLNDLRQAYQLDDIQGELTPLKGGSLHQVWQLKTTSGNFALKQLLKVSPKDAQQLALYRNTAAIAHLFLRMGLPAVPAKLTTDKDVFAISDDQVYMLFPWVDGKVVPARELSVDRSVRIATCLGMMHNLKLKIPSAEAWRFGFDAERWQALIEKAPDTIGQMLKEMLPDIEACHAVYAASLDEIMTDMVISHRDMHAPNLLWTSSVNFQIIDWDLAGQTPAATDLLYVLLDWSMERRVINRKKLTAMLCAYTSERPMTTRLTEGVVNAVLLNWLNWVQHQLGKFSDAHLSIATKTMIVSELRHSLLSYQVVRQETQRLCDMWNGLIES